MVRLLSFPAIIPAERLRRGPLTLSLMMYECNHSGPVETDWAPHPYSKRELAMAYAPEISPTSAVNRLMVWIHHHGELYEELRKAGYQDRQRVFSSRQVQLIFHYLGTP